jgi:hypothetical protein
MLQGFAGCFNGWNIRDGYARERDKSGSETSGVVVHYFQGATPQCGVKSGLRKRTFNAIQVT